MRGQRGTRRAGWGSAVRALARPECDFQRKPEQTRLAGKLQEWQTALFLPLLVDWPGFLRGEVRPPNSSAISPWGPRLVFCRLARLKAELWSQGLDHRHYPMASGADPEPDAALKCSLVPGPGPCCCHLLKPSGRLVGSLWPSCLFFFFFPLLLFPSFSFCKGRGEQSVAQPPSFPSPAEGSLAGRAGAGPQGQGGSGLISAAAFSMGPAWPLCLTAPSTFANTLWLQGLRAALEGTHLLPADPGGPRWHCMVGVGLGEGCAWDPTFLCLWPGTGRGWNGSWAPTPIGTTAHGKPLRQAWLPLPPSNRQRRGAAGHPAPGHPAPPCRVTTPGAWQAGAVRDPSHF